MDSLQEFDSTSIALPLTSTTGNTTATVASSSPISSTSNLSRYENQKRRDWNTFGNTSATTGPHSPSPGAAGRTLGKPKSIPNSVPFFGHPNPPAPCPCPLRQAWGSLDALIGRLRAAFEEHGGKPENNPFGARAVRLYLREVRDSQSKARGISYEKKKERDPHINSNRILR
ncbi:hypothetical protein MANES_03G163666v8 [Manihot esculenta]|uniref:Uncharacterized protein n=1 Tax=Manihot esculenta TaxID=3983 RepID=A0ACB7I138_MANES|nr:hypothetical protein MANES_03G163666v8 [Manihot esculenta]